VVRLDPPSNYDADDSEAKTIPAAALPDEIKALRGKLLAQQKPQRSTEPGGVPAHSPQSVVVAPEPPRVPQPPNLVKTIPAGAMVPPVSIPNMPVPGPARTTTGDTLSITSRADPSQWADDEPDAKTAIGLPFETGAKRPTPLRRGPPTAVVTEPSLPEAEVTNEEDDDFRETVASVRSNRSTVMVLLILVPLFIAAVLSILYALGLGPFGHERESFVEPVREQVNGTSVK
jgi:hypothetical protein